MRIAFFGDSLTEGRPGVSYVDILRTRLPEHEFANYGRGGESVVGTHKQIASLRAGTRYDLAFVWTGVNDVLAHLTWASPIIRTLLREPWANSRGEFIDEYRALLADLSRHALHIVAVAPLFIGEDLRNEWNRELDVRAAALESLCAGFDRVEFLNLRPFMSEVGSSACASPFVERRGLDTLWEAVALHTPEDVDRLSAERGLCYTVDGTHLNSRGAEVVANVFAQRIAQQRPVAS